MVRVFITYLSLKHRTIVKKHSIPNTKHGKISLKFATVLGGL